MLVWFSRVLSVVVLGMLALAGWIWQPFDPLAWRVRLPVAQSIAVRVVPLLMLATSSPGRWLLDRKSFTLHHGDIQLYDRDGLRMLCRHCWLQAHSVSPKPLMIPLLELTMQRQQHQINGVLKAGDNQHFFYIQFDGWISMRRVSLNWSLPRASLATLLRPMHAHSSAIAQSQVSGSLSANGTLRWPNPQWSANPELTDFKVSGLDISAATRQPIHYDCPLLDENKHPEKMQWLPADKLGRWLPMATMIAEDAGFKHHPGYQLSQMQHLLGKPSAEKTIGGSTITQQLAKYMFTNGERSWKRKIEELLYTVELESVLNKTQILTLYLNTVDLGPGICGAHAAASYYFNTIPEKLTPLQAAWLAGIIANPHRAWKQQYLTQKPDINRALRILYYMPERARKHPGDLNFRSAPAR